MSYKRPFKFKFDENADPVEEFHRLRVATAKYFKTPEALREYYRSTPSVEDLIAELDKEIAAKNAAKKERKSKSIKIPVRAGRRKEAKRLTPA